MRRATRAIIINDGKLLAMHRNKFGEEYYTLMGGNVEFGESLEQSLVREVSEESSLHLQHFRHVFTEEPGDPFGTQYIYLCEYTGEPVKLSDGSDEAKINQLGKNLYTPTWLSLSDLETVPFRSNVLRRAIISGTKYGFPKEPLLLYEGMILKGE